jgi:septal ring factor EnvC (AmiA/AmiB activator)
MSENISRTSKFAIRNEYFRTLRELKVQREKASELGHQLGALNNRCKDLMDKLDEMEADAKVLGIDISDSEKK